MGETEERAIPGADGEGFFRKRTLSAAALALGPEKFARAYPLPAIFVTDVQAGKKAGSPDDTARRAPSAFQIETLDGQSPGSASLRYHGLIAFLTKRPGNPFPNMISLGRAASSDIVFSLQTVSKLHGYFLSEGGAWLYTDYHSTNGTTVNGRRVDGDEKRPLRDGDSVKIGTDIVASFLLPASLFERVRGA